VGEDLLDDGEVLSALASCVALAAASLQSDAGDDPYRAATVLAGFNVDPEHALEALSSVHGLASLRLRLFVETPPHPGSEIPYSDSPGSGAHRVRIEVIRPTA